MKKHIVLPMDKYNYLLRHASHQDESPQLTTDQIIAVIPKRWQQKARALLQLVRDHVEWDARGQLIIDNEAIRGSHISDVLKHTVVPSFSKREGPIGSREFATVLTEINAPQSLVINKEREWYTL